MGLSSVNQWSQGQHCARHRKYFSTHLISQLASLIQSPNFSAQLRSPQKQHLQLFLLMLQRASALSQAKANHWQCHGLECASAIDEIVISTHFFSKTPGDANNVNSEYFGYHPALAQHASEDTNILSDVSMSLAVPSSTETRGSSLFVCAKLVLPSLRGHITSKFRRNRRPCKTIHSIIIATMTHCAMILTMMLNY